VVKAAGFGFATSMIFQCHVPVMEEVVQKIYPNGMTGCSTATGLKQLSRV